jgi:hypothetical protein
MYERRIVYTSRERREKKNFSLRKAVLVVTIFMILAGIAGAVYALRLPQWQIIKIEISSEVLSKEEIRDKILSYLAGEYMFLIPRSSIFMARTESIEQFLRDRMPRLKIVKVDKRFPDTLEVYAEERKPWAIYCNNLEAAEATSSPPIIREEHCVYIDKEGFSYEEAPDASGPLILKIKSDEEKLSLEETVVDAERISRITALADTLDKILGIKVIGYEIFSKIPREIRVVTADGFKIWLNLEDDFKNTAKMIQVLLNKEVGDKRLNLEYIDARFGNKIFYKLRK